MGCSRNRRLRGFIYAPGRGENFVTGADGLIFGAATSPAGLACAAILPNSSIGPAWALTAPKKSIDPAAKPATILRDNIQFIIIPPPPT
jgi:hypothetical protein